MEIHLYPTHGNLGNTRYFGMTKKLWKMNPFWLTNYFTDRKIQQIRSDQRLTVRMISGKLTLITWFSIRDSHLKNHFFDILSVNDFLTQKNNPVISLPLMWFQYEQIVFPIHFLKSLFHSGHLQLTSCSPPGIKDYLLNLNYPTHSAIYIS